MTAVPAVNRGSTRGRRASRRSGDDRELAILAAAERLLEQRTLNEISVDDLARAAGISRPTFYFYYPSKDAVLLTLLDRVIDEANTAAREVLSRLSDPRTRWRAAIDRYYQTWRSHRAVARAASQARATNVEARELWATVMEEWVRCTQVAIESERDRGAAPDGLPARDLAIALNAMNERVLYATLGDECPAIAEAGVVDVLLDIWLKSIYQTAAPPPG